MTPHVVILAGGDGRRLAPLTRALYGTELPKQFAILAGEKSLLQTTIERALALTDATRIMVVISAHHEPYARPQLEPYPGVELLVQPRGLDTGPGMLFPLARILAREPDAHVVFLPSDHHVADALPITQALRTAVTVLRDRVALLGVTPTGPEIEYGWIVRGGKLRGTDAFTVRRFEEKPPQPVADHLWKSGGLWNTFISAAPVRGLWELARRHLPRHASALEHYARTVDTAHEAHALHDAYATMQPANFSRDVLARAGKLAVVPVTGSGWSDWGSPARVFASLAGTKNHDRLVERIRLAS
jgi:mannose-1-phosphate guanylyltransferase